MNVFHALSLTEYTALTTRLTQMHALTAPITAVAPRP